ncbi:unnamed protein product [Diplocarpon coronariae]
MSQRPSASRPASRSPPEGQRLVLPPVQLRHDCQQEVRRAAIPQPEPEVRAYPQHLPASQHAPTSQPPPPREGWRSSRQPRDLGVHSILNPPESESGEDSRRRMSGGTNESPISAVGLPFEPGSSAAAALHTVPGQQIPLGMSPAGESHAAAFSRAPRRILTPNSPSARAVTAGRGAVVGTIDAHQTPFLASRGRRYIAEPGTHASSEAPGMPTPTSHQQQHGTMQAPGRTSLSQSASPSITVSSSKPPSSHDSPASFFHKGAPAVHPSSSYYPGSSFGTAIQAGGRMQYQGLSGIPEGPYTAPAPPSQCSSSHPSSASSSRQVSASDPIQVLTITTSEGIYTVPVDVTAASREADSKRARNAGASARFRQRRKEKEKEANTNIDKLQQQTRDLERKLLDAERERDRYRQERDRLRELVCRNPDTRHMAMQGPPSPQSVRSGALPGIGQQQLGAHPQTGFPESEDIPERASRRRRTDIQGAFASLPYALPPASTLTPVQAHAYPPGLGSRGHTSLPPLRIDNPSAPQTPNPSTAPPTSAGPPPALDPYARGSWDQGWSGDTARR